jgi:hypothetical protein
MNGKGMVRLSEKIPIITLVEMRDKMKKLIMLAMVFGLLLKGVT